MPALAPDVPDGDTAVKRLPQRKIARIIELADDGHTGKRIAEIVQCSEATVSRTLQTWADVRPLARRLLESRAVKLAETVVKTKDAGVALKALAKLDVVREDAAPGGNQVMVVLGATVDPLTGKALSPSVSPVFHSLTTDKP